MNKKRNNYSTKKKFNIKIFLIVLIIFLIMFSMISKSKQQEEKEEYIKNIKLEDIQTIEDLILKFGNKYIKEEKSREKNFELDIYVEFKDNINEIVRNNSKYIEKIIIQIARISDYENFRIIDSKQQKIISVVCSNENKVVQEMYINGTEYNKFITLLEKAYKEEEQIEVEINSEILKKLISESWNTEKLRLGKNYTEDGKYITYPELGITMKKIVKQAYSIIFSKEYKENIVNGISIDTSLEEIKDKLGDPIIDNDYFIGYKTKDFYIFFNETDIAVYKNLEEELIETSEEFSDLVKKFAENGDAKTFINELTYLYDDYDVYNYDENFVSLIYYARGIKVRFNVGTFNGLTIYKNFSGDIVNGISVRDIVNGESIESNYINVEIEKNLLEEFEENRISGFMEPEHGNEDEL